MTENWDSYFCEVDGKPASMVVDIGVALQAPMAAYPFMCYLSIQVRKPEEYGFPGGEEHDVLAVMEDALEAELTAQGDAVYVGHCTVDGRMDLYFYCRQGEGWGERVKTVMRPFSSYFYDSGCQHDPEWVNYRDFLFPGEYDLLMIQNRRVCRRLQEMGDDPARARFVDHWAEFSSERDARAFSEAVRLLGYEIKDISLAPEHLQPDNTGREEFFDGRFCWQVQASRPESPDQIDEISFALFDLARSHNGEYQGWACPPAGP